MPSGTSPIKSTKQAKTKESAMKRSWMSLTPILFALLPLTPAHAQNIASAELGLSLFHSLHQHAQSFPAAKIFIFGDVFDVGMLPAEHMAGTDGITMCRQNMRNLLRIGTDRGRDA